MRTMDINKQTFYYCLYEGHEEQYDEYGNLTGENAPKYSTAKRASGNISVATGNTNLMQFGEALDYDKVIVMDSTKMDESSVLFVDKKPEYDENGAPLFDYIVKRVSKSLNSVSIAIERVDVS